MLRECFVNQRHLVIFLTLYENHVAPIRGDIRVFPLQLRKGGEVGEPEVHLSDLPGVPKCAESAFPLLVSVQRANSLRDVLRAHEAWHGDRSAPLLAIDLVVEDHHTSSTMKRESHCTLVGGWIVSCRQPRAQLVQLLMPNRRVLPDLCGFGIGEHPTTVPRVQE